jgi:hypothetical protein
MAREALAKRYRARRRDWLAGVGEWPMVLPLGIPSEPDAQRQPDGVRAWVAAWQQWQGAGEIVWAERHWSSLGTQSLPERLLLPGAASVAAFIGEGRLWQQAVSRYQRLAARWPAMAARLPRHFDVLADYPDAEIERLEALLEWLQANPRSGLYARQLPIAGLDTKWLEGRMALIAGLLGEVNLRPIPHLVRFRLLDETLRRRLGGLSDIAARVDDLAGLDLPVSRVFIVENLQTGMAFDDLPGSLVLLGLGYGVSALASLPWVARAQCVYWGDLDTHGFAILDRARSCLPQIESVLMDEETLLRHRSLWVAEKEQCSAGLPRLTPVEQAVYRGLREQRWGVNVRLEQERIAWNYAWPVLQDAAR